jgi:hypothetical protein
MDDVAAALAAEASLLKVTLQRNKAQHRRSKYYRALHGGVAVVLAQLEPGRFPQLLQRSSAARAASSFADVVQRVGPSLDAALVAVAKATHSLKQAARALKQEIAAGYFIALCVAWLAMTARILELLRALTKSLLAHRRAMAMPERPCELGGGSVLAATLEWLLTYGDAPGGTSRALGMSGRSSITITGSSTSSNRIGVVGSRCIGSTQVDPAKNGHADDDDFGEVVAFAPSFAATATARVQDTTAEPASSSAHTEQVFLAIDYSDSEDDSNDEKNRKKALQTCQDDPSILGWILDTDIEQHGDAQSVPQASSAGGVLKPDSLRCFETGLSSLLAADYSDSDAGDGTSGAFDVQVGNAITCNMHRSSPSTALGEDRKNSGKSRSSLLAADCSGSEEGCVSFGATGASDVQTGHSTTIYSANHTSLSVAPDEDFGPEDSSSKTTCHKLVEKKRKLTKGLGAFRVPPLGKKAKLDVVKKKDNKKKTKKLGTDVKAASNGGSNDDIDDIFGSL